MKVRDSGGQSGPAPHRTNRIPIPARTRPLVAPLLVVLLMAACAGNALGQEAPKNAIVFSPAIFFRTLETEAGEDERLFISGLNLGFKFSAFYFGFLLSQESTDPPDSRQKSYGPSIGLIVSGYDIIITRHIFSQRDTGTSRLKDGAGFQIDLGRKFMQSPNFGLGPRLSFRRIEYQTEQVGGVDSKLPGGVTVKQFQPTFALIIFF